MAQLWGGRFSKQTDDAVFAFNESASFDKRMYREDITGSKAHALMLFKQGIITEKEKDDIENGLDSILKEMDEGTLGVTAEYEDIHSFVEAELTARIGDPGRRLHTGRSRNDQVATDLRLYLRGRAERKSRSSP